MPADLQDGPARAPAARRLLAVAAIAATAAGALAGCGSSSKPGYCSDRSNLQDSVTSLKDVSLSVGAISSLQSKLQNVQSDAQALVSSAKSDFPDETDAITSSVSKLSSDLKALGS